MAIAYPPKLINDYLIEKIGTEFGFTFPIFPSSPTAIEDLTEGFPDATNNVFGVYDRMFRMRRKAFPHIKCEQLLYYFYKTANTPEQLIEVTQRVYDLLDREDESAQEVNSWIRSKLNADGLYVASPGTPQEKQLLPVFFHNFKIYQLQETRDIIDFGTARTYAGNKIIIDYDYHAKGYNTGNTQYNDTNL
jgi:hypothetical protein